MFSYHNLSLKALISSVALSSLLSGAVLAEAPPTYGNGIIGNKTLIDNQDVINAQGVGAIITFMDEGAKECDALGENCRSLFGADDSFDFTTSTGMSQSSTGANSYSFMGMQEDSNNVASQVGSLALVCGDNKTHIVAGVAFKASECSVNANGDAKLTFQVCTGPMRGVPESPAENAVVCSTDPTHPTFYPPNGKTCLKKSCDTEQVGSLDGWSYPETVHWIANMPPGSSDKAREQNGLGLIFFPDLQRGVVPSLSADSENLTAINISQSILDPLTGQQAIGLHLAYRHKMTLTKEMMQDGPNAVGNPSEHNSQWDSIQKLSVNPMTKALEDDIASTTTDCMQKLQEGLITENEVEVCDPNFRNESGLRPIDLTAKIAGPEEGCGTTTQCLKQVFNTNTWKHTCHQDVPLSIRTCNTETDYQMEDIHTSRSRTHDRCTEERSRSSHMCDVYANPENCTRDSAFYQGGMDFTHSYSDMNLRVLSQDEYDYTRRYRFGVKGDNYWRNTYTKRDVNIYIHDLEMMKHFTLDSVGFDDHVFIEVNGHLVYQHSSFQGRPGKWFPEHKRYGWIYTWCAFDDEEEPGCTWTDKFVSEGRIIERNTSWHQSIGRDIRNHLREGHNHIRVHTLVGGEGEMWMDFTVSGYIDKCEISTQNECTQWENAQ